MDAKTRKVVLSSIAYYIKEVALDDPREEDMLLGMIAEELGIGDPENDDTGLAEEYLMEVLNSMV